jgi:hypothetical protein
MPRGSNGYNLEREFAVALISLKYRDVLFTGNMVAA